MAVATEPRLLRRLWKPALTVVVFVVLLAGLRRVLSDFDYDEVVDGFDQVPRAAIAAMVGALILQHALYVGREYAAVRYAGREAIGVARIALASLISRSLSTLGVATITGFALRLRIYEAFGLSRAEVGKVTVYNESTYFVGLLAATAAVLSVAELPPMIGTRVALPPTRVVGVAALVVLAAYTLWSLRRARPLRIRSFELPVMPAPLLAAQIALPVLDAFIAGAIVWTALPAAAGLSYLETTTLCVLAGIAGSLSQVPGGLGVFEATVLAFVPERAHPVTLAALLVRRAVVNVLPIAVGAVLLVGVELYRREDRRPSAVHTSLVPSAVAVWTFAAGVLAMIAAAVPVPRGPIVEAGPVAQGVTFAAGVATLVVARHLHLHSPSAWVLALVLAGLRAAVAASAGPHWSAFGLAITSVGLLLLSRRSFDGKPPDDDDDPTDVAVRWWTAVAVAVLGVGWIAVAHPDTTDRLARARAAGIVAVVAIAIGTAVISARRARRRTARAAREALRVAALEAAAGLHAATRDAEAARDAATERDAEAARDAAERDAAPGS